MRKLLKAIGIVCVLLLAVTSANAASQYNVTYLGNFSPRAINSKGDVIGCINTSPFTSTSFLYSKGILTELETLGVGCYASDINDSGQIVGYYMLSDDEYHAFIYSDDVMTDLGTFGGLNSTAYGINNNGQIAANYETSDKVIHAVLYDHGSTTGLGDFGGSMTVAGFINSTSTIVGHANNAAGNRFAFVYSEGIISDLGIPGHNAYALGINDADQIVGCSQDDEGVPHTFIYLDGSISGINELAEGSMANAINANGEIVGLSFPNNKAFVYSNNSMRIIDELIIDPPLGMTLSDACDINDSGQILASGSCDKYGSGAFLLTPIPEPSSLLLLFIALSGVAINYWRQNHIV